MIIPNAESGDEARWRILWAGYCAFYRAELVPGVTDATWRRILDPTIPLFARVAVIENQVVGFANGVLHEGTWVTDPICYLEDLYVDPPSRGQGVARRLIEDLISLGRAAGWSRLYWHTDSGNTAARRVYDGFLLADSFVRYRVSLDGER